MNAKSSSPQSAEPWTIKRLLTWTTDYLRQRGSDSPQLDSQILLADALGCQRIELYTRFDQEPSQGQRDHFRELLQRRARGEPVAYITGRREFYSINLRVTPDVLIPRPETEHLVVETLEAIRRRPPADAPPRVVDVGTGSGAIAISVAKHAPHAVVTATDIHPPALAVARSNAREQGVEARIEFREGDLLEAVAADDLFDVVVCNPPYVAHAEESQVAPEVMLYEPHIALFGGGQRGTDIIQRLLAQVPGHLVPGGKVIVEVSPMIAAEVRNFAHGIAALGDVQVKRDLAGLDRVLLASRSP